MSDNKIPYEELIIRYLDGDASAEEITLLEEWMAASPANKLEFDQMQALFLLSGDIELADKIDVEADLDSMKSRLPSKSGAHTKSLTSRILKIAASVVLVATASYIFYLNSSNSNEHLIALSDGTKVYLRDDANLSYPETFSLDERRVTLHGEAYFEVSHDKTRPFIVEAGDTEVRVLGTTFLVEEQADQVGVTVQSGKVRFSPKTDNDRHLILTANERGSFEDDQLKEEVNTNKNYLSWHTGNFEFSDTHLSAVLQELSTYYPEMKLGVSAKDDCPLTATFKKEKLQTVIIMIESSCQLTAIKSGDGFVFN